MTHLPGTSHPGNRGHKRPRLFWCPAHPSQPLPSSGPVCPTPHALSTPPRSLYSPDFWCLAHPHATPCHPMHPHAPPLLRSSCNLARRCVQGPPTAWVWPSKAKLYPHAHLEALHACLLALCALHPQHNLLGGLCLRKFRRMQQARSFFHSANALWLGQASPLAEPPVAAPPG